MYLYNGTNGKGIDGIAAVKNIDGQDYFAATCDPATGDLVNVFYYDYYKTVSGKQAILLTEQIL